MRLKPEETKKLAAFVCDSLQKDSSITLKVPRAQIMNAIQGVLGHHFDEERRLEDRAELLYAERAPEFGAMDKSKALQRIKHQLAEEAKFVLSGGKEGRFSQDKVFQMAHLVDDKLYDDDLVDFEDEDEGIKFFKRLISGYFEAENQIDEKVRKKILSLSKAPFEGSREWEVLFKKYREEELRRINHGGD